MSYGYVILLKVVLCPLPSCFRRIPKWPCQHQCPHGRTSSPKWLLPVSMFPGWVPVASVSSGDSPRSAGVSDPGSFQITASVLGFGACEILCVPFNSGVSIFHSPLGLLKVSPTGLQSYISWGLVFLMQDSLAEVPDMELGLFALGENLSAIVIILLFVGSPPRSMGLDYTASMPLLLILLCFLPYRIGCRRSFLLVFCSFSWIIAL